jgi:hypothetical protein
MLPIKKNSVIVGEPLTQIEHHHCSSNTRGVTVSPSSNATKEVVARATFVLMLAAACARTDHICMLLTYCEMHLDACSA